MYEYDLCRSKYYNVPAHDVNNYNLLKNKYKHNTKA